MDNFDLKRFLVENKMTRNSRLLNESATYDTLDDEIKQSYDGGKILSVVFVKSDGTVRPMAFSKFTKKYKPSENPKSDAQANVLINNNLMVGYDRNVYNKLKKELGYDKSLPLEQQEQIEQEAAKKSYRRFKLDQVLGFLAGGKFYDLRAENNIPPEIAGQLTDRMKQKAAAELNQAESSEPTTDEPQLNENISDLVVTYYKDKDNYGEKGLADGFYEEEGKKVKFIVGYDDMDEMDDIGYIYSKSYADIETDYTEDDLDNAFMNSL